jgi:hypothetical protein
MKALMALDVRFPLLTITGCVKTATVNYPMTIEVEGNSKIHLGRSVWRQTFQIKKFHSYNNAIFDGIRIVKKEFSSSFDQLTTQNCEDASVIWAVI